MREFILYIYIIYYIINRQTIIFHLFKIIPFNLICMDKKIFPFSHFPLKAVFHICFNSFTLFYYLPLYIQSMKNGRGVDEVSLFQSNGTFN